MSKLRAEGDPDLKIYGVFGYPLAHTVSPEIQNEAFNHHGLKSLYFALERTPKEFSALLRRRKTLLLDGFNLTVPFKEKVIRFLDQLSPEARAIGAVNTVKRQGKKWLGFNTDVFGFLAGLKEAKFKVRGKDAVVLGAGGAARGTVYALASQGAKQITIANRTTSKARKLALEFSKKFKRVQFKSIGLGTQNLAEATRSAQLIVNTTKVGLKKSDPSLLLKSAFPKKRALIYDLIYRPTETKFLVAARKLGHRVQNGETMLLMQGAKAFEIWTGKKAPVRQMRKALANALS